MEQRNLEVQNRLDFIKYLDAISRVSDTCITTIHKDGYLSTLVASPDNTLILYSELLNITTQETCKINVPDTKRLIRVLETINTQNLNFKLNNNSLEYRDSSVRFKYHLYEDGFLTLPSINVEKVKSFNTDVSFTITKETLQSIIKSSSFTADTNKLYLYEEEGRLKGELTDRARHNTDMITLDLGVCDYALSPIPLNLDNIKLLTTSSADIQIGINTKHGVAVIENRINDIKLKYIITSLTQ